MKVHVVCYEGYRAEETPRAFLLEERRVEVVRILDRWRGEDHEYVKLDGSDGARYILRYDRTRDEWEIQMMEFPSPMDGGDTLGLVRLLGKMRAMEAADAER